MKYDFTLKNGSNIKKVSVEAGSRLEAERLAKQANKGWDIA